MSCRIPRRGIGRAGAWLIAKLIATAILGGAIQGAVTAQQLDSFPAQEWFVAPATFDASPMPSDELAEEANQEPASEATVADLNQRLDELEAAVRAASKPEPGKDDRWNVRLGGHLQPEFVSWAQADPAIPRTHDYFAFRRLRIVADGTGYGFLDFRLQMTLEPESLGESPVGLITSPDVKDAYLSANDLPGLQRIRFGNFFVPFSLEQVTNDTNNIFLERSIPTQGIFAADREVGVAVYGQNEDHRLTWAYGTFFDSISEGLKERIDDNQGNRVSGRLTWLPYFDEASKGRYLIHTGVGILHTHDQDKRVRFRARPQVHEGPRLIDSGAIDANTYTTGNLELACVNGPFTVQSEAFLSGVNRIEGGESYAKGCYVHGSYFLTGENRIYERFGQHGAQFGRNVPTARFDPRQGHRGIGAWELKSRWSYLDLEDLDAGQYNDLTVGFNWYWTDRVRWMFDWIHPVTSTGTTYGATHSDLLGLRLDFNW